MAALQLFGRKKNRETQKGERWLKEHRIDFHFIDLDQKPLSPGELDGIARTVGGHQALIDVDSNEYRNGGWAHRSFDVREELLAHPALVQVPILRAAPKAIVGFDEMAWKLFVGTK
jgi:arsenate reductase-like glutaredoxin family protein